MPFQRPSGEQQIPGTVVNRLFRCLHRPCWRGSTPHRTGYCRSPMSPEGLEGQQSGALRRAGLNPSTAFHRASIAVSSPQRANYDQRQN